VQFLSVYNVYVLYILLPTQERVKQQAVRLFFRFYTFSSIFLCIIGLPVSRFPNSYFHNVLRCRYTYIHFILIPPISGQHLACPARLLHSTQKAPCRGRSHPPLAAARPQQQRKPADAAATPAAAPAARPQHHPERGAGAGAKHGGQPSAGDGPGHRHSGAAAAGYNSGYRGD
jgi:hypothetical protein